MNFDNLGDDEEQNSNDPSGTHIYFYERGHERLPGDEGDDEYEQLAAAYEKAKTQPQQGIVRSYANSQYTGGLTQMLAEFVNTMGECLEQESPRPLVELALGDLPQDAAAEVIAQWLDQNEGAKEELAERLANDKSAQPADD